LGHGDHDRLTGLWDRWGWDDQALRILEHARQRRQHLALLVMDLDRFKNINDEYGHLAGDTVLTVAADVLRTHTRPDDLIGRYGGHGGDEFLVLLPRTSRVDAAGIAERIRTGIGSGTLAVTATFGAATLSGLTASIGVAAGIPNTDLTLHDLILRADAALQHAKRNGRDRIQTVGLTAGDNRGGQPAGQVEVRRGDRVERDAGTV
jgi:diguanylate cyclase (GGDEF)-like protein